MKNLYFLTFCLLLSIYTFLIKVQAQSQTSLREEGKQAFDELKSHFHRYVDEGKIAGMVMLVAHQNRVLTDAYGLQSLENHQKMSENTIFRIASMTKPLTSVAVMMLLEEGKIQLEDSLTKFLPIFENQKVFDAEKGGIALLRKIQIKDLLTHTSGIASGDFAQQHPVNKIYKDALKQTKPQTLETLVQLLATLPLANQPGESWTYGFSTDLLAAVVAKVSGMSFEAFLQKKILQPLKMKDTGFHLPEDKSKNLASVYSTDKDQKLKLLESAEQSRYINGENYPRGVGGLVSTITDYYRFCKMLLNGGELDGVRLLKPETVERMTKNQLPDHLAPVNPALPPICNGFGLGFGVQTEKVILGWEGDYLWPGAMMTYFVISPKTQTIGIFMSQLVDLSKLHLLAEFHNLAVKVFQGNGISKGK